VTRRALVVIGGGEHARVVVEAAAAGAGWEPTGFTEVEDPVDRPRPAVDGRALPCLGTDEACAAALEAMDAAARPWLVLGFGGPAAAREEAARVFGPEARWATVIHPAAWVSPSATLGAGVVVLAAAVVNAGAVLGDHAIVNSGAVVEHDVHVGRHAHVAPGATIGGGATIGAGAFVGLGASVRDHVRIGDGATVGMGAAVVGDVRDDTVVVGVPARDRAGSRRG
jgi:acetyltransferase EpsM